MLGIERKIRVPRTPAGMVEITKGMAEGMESFINNDGQLVGESPRAGIYTFLLLEWPEIKGLGLIRPMGFACVSLPPLRAIVTNGCKLQKCIAFSTGRRRNGIINP